MSLEEEKRRLRALVKSRVAAMGDQVRRRESIEAVRLIEDNPHYRAARTVLLFHSLPDEPDTHALVRRAARSKTVLLPAVKEDGTLEIRRYCGTDDTMRAGAYGIQEPQGGLYDTLEEIDFIAVPGRAFDRTGNRTGRGAGYYDRFLSQPQLARAYKCGVCFSVQMTESVPAGKHDMRMDEVVFPEE